MRQIKIVSSILVMVFFMSGVSFGQDDLLAFRPPSKKGAFNEIIEVTDKDKAKGTPVYFRKHRKMPSFFSGYAIELISSETALNRDFPLFEKFGNVHVQTLERGGFSYLIKGFRNKKACLTFLNKVVLHQAPKAKMFKYKGGERVK